jgi:hypothetical protein
LQNALFRSTRLEASSDKEFDRARRLIGFQVEEYQTGEKRGVRRAGRVSVFHHSLNFKKVVRRARAPAAVDLAAKGNGEFPSPTLIVGDCDAMLGKGVDRALLVLG